MRVTAKNTCTPNQQPTIQHPAQLTKHLDKSTLSNPEGEGRVIPAQRFQALSRLEKTWAGFSREGRKEGGGRRRRGINPRGKAWKEENTARWRRRRRRRWRYRSGSALENFSRLGCTLFDRYRQDASSFAFVSSRRGRGGGSPEDPASTSLKRKVPRINRRGVDFLWMFFGEIEFVMVGCQKRFFFFWEEFDWNGFELVWWDWFFFWGGFKLG